MLHVLVTIHRKSSVGVSRLFYHQPELQKLLDSNGTLLPLLIIIIIIILPEEFTLFSRTQK